MNRIKQKGYTLFELLLVIATLVGISLSLFFIYVVFHFIFKFW